MARHRRPHTDEPTDTRIPDLLRAALDLGQSHRPWRSWTRRRVLCQCGNDLPCRTVVIVGPGGGGRL
jgi:hypothetical protein